MTNPTRLTIETGTTALTGLSCFKIKMITATAFTTLTCGPGSTVDGDSLSGVTFPADFELEGNFSSVTLASGSVVLYQHQ
jgi:hypothetical protein